jgi:hypothetical protein
MSILVATGIKNQMVTSSRMAGTSSMKKKTFLEKELQHYQSTSHN